MNILKIIILNYANTEDQRTPIKLLDVLMTAPDRISKCACSKYSVSINLRMKNIGIILFFLDFLILSYPNDTKTLTRRNLEEFHSRR